MSEKRKNDRGNNKFIFFFCHVHDIFIDKLEKAGPHNVQVVEDHLHLDLESDDEIVNEAEDTMTILSKYIDALDISTDKQLVEQTIKDLYNEALTVA